jgi:hypothetical protein
MDDSLAVYARELAGLDAIGAEHAAFARAAQDRLATAFAALAASEGV